MKPTRNFFSSRRSSRAFTIVELLVAITITAAITAFMVTIVINVLNVWSRSSAILNAGNQARQILDQVSSDLQTVVIRRSSDVMFAATISNVQGNGPDGSVGTGDAGVAVANWSNANIKPGNTAAPNGSLHLNPADRDLTAYRFGQAGVWLRFFSTPPDNSTNAVTDVSAPRAIAYQIVRRRVGSNTSPYSYQLYRSEVAPFRSDADPDRKSTFEQGYDLFGANGYNDPADANNGGTNEGDPGNVRRPNGAYVLGNGIIDFGVRIFTRNSAGVLEEAFPVDRRGGGSTVRRVFASTTNITKTHPATALASGNFFDTQTSYDYPDVVEVMVRILSPEGIETIEAYETDPNRFGGASPEKWWQLAEANSRVYVRRIEIKAKSF